MYQKEVNNFSIRQFLNIGSLILSDCTYFYISVVEEVFFFSKKERKKNSLSDVKNFHILSEILSR